VIYLNNSEKDNIRFKTPEQLQDYLERAGNDGISFRAYPISGEPQTFHLSGGDIVRKTDGRSFESIGNFTCYAFQCDAEGYARTEYVDLEVLN
jgi:hypothetical protein